ncbi:CFI-box-CTERM domain-containing protein [Duganella vulcania]|uniref:CFI-box-CTERM domain-containing protein n=1 Tax=Duganella vulcania TaxID=2692166 RepID=UPI003530A8A1
MLFEHRLGRRVSPTRAKARRDGVAAHEAFHLEASVLAPGVGSSEAKPWCFIATELFGESAWETITLRMCRDRILRPYPAGRAFIGMYYRHSPAIARWLCGHRRSRACARLLLRPAAVLLKWLFVRYSSLPGTRS